MSYIKKLLLLFFLSIFTFVGGRYVTTALATEKIRICHGTSSVTNPYENKSVDEDSTTAEGHMGHVGPIATSVTIAQSLKNDQRQWGDIIPPVANIHTGLNWTPEGQAIWNNNCNLVKEVHIDNLELSCGSSERTFTGTANFQGDNNDWLVVKLDGNIVVDNHTQPASWSFTSNVGVGSHTIEAWIYNSSKQTVYAHDVWIFEIGTCTQPPVDVCPLIDGVEDPTIQIQIPVGYHKDEDSRNCVKDQTPPVEPTNPEVTNPPVGGPPGPPQCGAQKPPKPQTLSAEKTSPTTVKLTWSAVTPVTYYAISYGTDPNNFQFGVPNAGNSTSFVVGALNPNLKYYFKVIAVNDCMPSDPSAEVSPGGVLGASTEKVLGASTDRLAATDSNLYLPRIMAAAVFFVLSLTSGVKFLHGSKKS